MNEKAFVVDGQVREDAVVRRPDQDRETPRQYAVTPRPPHQHACDVRMECVRLLIHSNQYANHVHAIVDHARVLSDFVLGARDAETIAAARRLAEVIR